MKKTSKKHAIFAADILSISHEGRGITQREGKTIFVTGALPGEHVHCQTTKIHRTYDEAITIKVVRASPERVIPPCPHYGICGGCSMQHIATHHQVELKQKMLLDQLARFGKVYPQDILPPLQGNSWGYRRRARLGVRYLKKNDEFRVGFREKMSNQLTTINECLILQPTIGKNLVGLRTMLASLTQREHIPQVEIAVGDTATALVIRHMYDLPPTDRTTLQNYAQRENLHLYLQPNPPQLIHKLWPLDGCDYLTYDLADYQVQMHFHPLDFTQINASVNTLMIKQALALLDPCQTDRILDLFCGLGNFTLPLARYSAHVTGVEGTVNTVNRAQQNALRNGFTNVTFFANNLMAPQKPMPDWLKQTYHKILLDPPRSGAKDIISYLPALAAQQIVYVSCNPATLARDAGVLVHQQGYTLKKIGVINMFPQTSHIEAIALFVK